MRTHAYRTPRRTAGWTVRRLPAIAALILAAAFLPACTSSSDHDATNKTNNQSGESEQSEDEHAEAEGEEPGEEEGEEGGEGWNEDIEHAAEAAGPELPEDSFLFQRLMTSGSPDLNAFGRAKQQATALTALAARTTPQLKQRRWEFLGPENVGGRVTDGVVDPTRPNTIYVAASTNGVWRSSDAGQTFTSVWPDDITHSMGALAIAPNGMLYAGTGETNPGGGSITYGGNGVYRSTNHGLSWQRVGLTRSGTIGRIVIDPKAPDRIWVAVSGNLFTPGGQRGVYESTDGGDTWKRSLRPPNELTGATDIAIDPANSRHLIATMWDHIRRPSARIYTGIGSGVWETHNAGRTWKRLGPAQGLLAPSGNTGRIGVTFSPADADRAWIIYSNDETGAFQDFFRSDDNGASWQRPPGTDQLADSQSVYGWWFGRLYADPEDADRLYVLGLDLWETRDAGATFDTVPDIHVDQHVVMYDPAVPDRTYVGNDGGLYVSEDNGASFTKSEDQPWSQYSGVDVSEQDQSHIVGGLQDNGTQATWVADGSDWGSIFGGDGQRSLIDPTDADNYYACAQYGVCAGFEDGSSFQMQFTSKRFPYFMQYAFNPKNTDVMYGGGSELNKSTDEGHTWTVISDDLGKGEAGDEPNPLYRNHYGTVSALAVAPSRPRIVWAGTDNGYLYRSADAGASWQELPNPVRPKLWIQRLVVAPDNARTVYLTFSGYREGDNSAYVLRTRNNGQTWTDITANLPHAPVNDLAVVGDRLYVATDVGVFTSPASRPRWTAYGSGMPQLVTTDLRYVPENATLYVATFGMGVWSIKA
ncbi:MAG TPA: hypothetical protein VH419_15135 [Nocardioidaceae bacterium]|jgi:photosystem II stability/assembly factor-like uncharacterized protein